MGGDLFLYLLLLSGGMDGMQCEDLGQYLQGVQLKEGKKERKRKTERLSFIAIPYVKKKGLTHNEYSHIDLPFSRYKI